MPGGPYQWLVAGVGNGQEPLAIEWSSTRARFAPSSKSAPVRAESSLHLTNLSVERPIPAPPLGRRGAAQCHGLAARAAQ